MARVEADLEEEESTGRDRGRWGRRSEPVWRHVAAAMIVLGLVSSYFAVRFFAELETRSHQLVQTELALEEALDRLQASQTLIASLTAPDGRAVQLAGTGPATEAHARAYIDPQTRRLVVFVYDLPPLPEDQTYQLWVIAEGEAPVDAGIFATDADGRGRHDAITVPAVAGPATIAVTIEPAQGVPQPTGPIVLAGA